MPLKIRYDTIPTVILMLIIYYIITLALLLLNFVYFILNKKRSESSLTIAFYLFMVIAGIGYVSLAFSRNVEEALASMRIIYIGGIYVPVAILGMFSRFIKFKYHNILMVIILLFSSSLYATFLFTTRYTDLWYSSLSLGQEYGCSYLIRSYGPLRMLRIIYLLGTVIIFAIFTLYAFKKSEQVSYKNTLLYGMVVIAFTSVSFVSNFLSPALDLMPLFYVFGGQVVMVIIRRMQVYNISYAASINLENKEFYGCIGLDLKENYTGTNNDIFTIYPEFKQLKLDRPLPEEGEIFTLIRNTINNINSNDKDPKNYFIHERNGRMYRFSIQLNQDKKRKVGYFVEVTDDTKRIEYENRIRKWNEELKNEVERQTAHIKTIQEKVILGMADLVESRDDNTGGHVKRTSDIVAILTESIKKHHIYDKDDEFYEFVRRSAPMHDLGKTVIPDDILNKPGKYTPEEYEVMKTHPVIGEKMVRSILEGVENPTFVSIARHVALYHHEKYGGGGYPENLSGANIPIEARIMALADVYDALVSKRVYKERMSFEKAKEIITHDMGTHFDPLLLPVFNECEEALKAYYLNLENKEA